jgi:ribosomal protein L11 methyltransferase
MTKSSKPSSGVTEENLDPWLDCRFGLADSQAARRLTRLLKKAGAAHVWQQGSQVWSLWPDEPDAMQTVQRLAAEAGVEPEVKRLSSAQPTQAWREPQPREVGPGLALAPAWMGLAASAQVLVIEAGTAFGAGDHPSTWLNLALIARLLAGRYGPAPAPGWAVDLGAGSGVLALGLALAGGFEVLALDPDPAARRAVAHNRALNPLAANKVHFVQATHEALAGRYGLVTANLPWGILRLAGSTMAACLEPGGWLLLSGFREEAASEVLSFLGGLGLHEQARQEAQGWLALGLARP